MPNIIVKKYEHINRALPNWDTPTGKYIKDKDHYDYEMKKAGMVSYDEAKKKEKLRLSCFYFCWVGIPFLHFLFKYVLFCFNFFFKSGNKFFLTFIYKHLFYKQ
mgnify:CR=1 FL=1